MSFQFITEAPAWLILFCILAGGVYAFILYRKETSFSETRPWLVRLMAGFRFLSVTILGILLLSPLIRTIFREVEKPVVILLQDNSRSVAANRDSVFYRSGYPEAFNAMKRKLEENFDVREFSVGDKLEEGIGFTFDEKETDLSTPVNELKARFSGRNLGAVVMATDGLYNKGSSPVYAWPGLHAPIYTIGLGDTAIHKDLLITKVNHNKTVFAGNTFPVEITIDARKCAGQNAVLTVSRQDEVLFSRILSIPSNRFNMVVPVFLQANQKGINHYKATLDRLDDEINYENNSIGFFVEVAENRQKILIVSAAPHPDIGALKNILETNPNYEVKYVPVNEFDGNLQDVNLVIMYQLPSVTNTATSLIAGLQKQEIPAWYILGSQTNVSAFNNLETGVKISDNRDNVTEVIPDPVRDFSLFTIEDEYFRRIASFPPVSAPFGNYSVSGSIYPVLRQKIGAVKTPMPLWFFSQGTGQRLAVLVGEGIWKWRLHEYSEFSNTEAINALVNKTVQYLATKEKKTPFRLINRNTYTENEPILFDAELYNESGELVNTDDVQIIFTNEEGKNFPFTFSRNEKGYTLNAGYFPAGVYRYTASVQTGGVKHTASGTIIITALQAENSETIANHEMLHALSEKTGGMFYSPDSLNALADEISSRNDIRPVTYTQKRLTDVINLKWIFSLIILLLSAEWFLRKRSGSY